MTWDPELKQVLELLTEVSRCALDEVPITRPLGVDAILPEGWRDEAHHRGRSPWDIELRSALIESQGAAVVSSLFAPTESAPDEAGRTPPDRRVTELDWRNLSLSERS